MKINEITIFQYICLFKLVPPYASVAILYYGNAGSVNILNGFTIFNIQFTELGIDFGINICNTEGEFT